MRSLISILDRPLLEVIDPKTEREASELRALVLRWRGLEAHVKEAELDARADPGSYEKAVKHGELMLELLALEVELYEAMLRVGIKGGRKERKAFRNLIKKYGKEVRWWERFVEVEKRDQSFNQQIER